MAVAFFCSYQRQALRCYDGRCQETPPGLRMYSDIPPVMQAMVLTGHGGYEKLKFVTDCPTPQPGLDDVLIEVHACGLNNTDINVRTGWYSKSVVTSTGENTRNHAIENDPGDASPPDDAGWGGTSFRFPRIQGADAVGTVVALGRNADPSLLHKRVLIDTWLRDRDDPSDMNKSGYFGSEIDGGFAQYTKVDYRNVHPVNSSLTHAELATFATSYATAENMLSRAQVSDADTVLVTGASGGVGSALIQLAHRRGARVIALCGERKRPLVESLGPQAILPRSPDNLERALFEATGDRTVSVVADVVGGEMFGQLVGVLRRGGRYTCAGAIAGPLVSLDLRTFYLNDLTFTGATFVPPGMFASLVSYIESGQIKPLLAETFSLENLHDAQRMFLAKTHLGNIVVEPEVVSSVAPTMSDNQ